MSDARSGVLSLVGTPIGNLEDASPRVLQTLRDADLLLCEDTRVTSRLLARFGIQVSLMRCDQNVMASRVRNIIDRVEDGERIAFVSDAGMPGISDPGQQLADAALLRGVKLEVVPGPSAVTCALIASGLPCASFFFDGFLPRKAGARAKRLRELACVPGTLVFYESPHRALATIQSIAEVMPLRRVALVRELTKLHEEVVRDLAPELARCMAERDEVRGECVIVVEGPVEGENDSTESEGRATLEESMRLGLESGESKTRLAKRLAKEFGVARADVYNMIVEAATSPQN